MSCYSSCASQIRSSVPFIPVKERQSLHCLRTGLFFLGLTSWGEGVRICMVVTEHPLLYASTVTTLQSEMSF